MDYLVAFVESPTTHEDFTAMHDLKAVLDGGRKLPFPDGILINGRGGNGYYLTVEQAELDNGRVELVAELVEVTHTNLTEVTRVVFVKEDPVVVHTSCISTTSRVFPVLSNSTMTCAHVTSLLPVLLEASSHLWFWRRGTCCLGFLSGCPTIDSLNTECLIQGVERRRAEEEEDERSDDKVHGFGMKNARCGHSSNTNLYFKEEQRKSQRLKLILKEQLLIRRRELKIQSILLRLEI
uniref:Uncharacterized protein n=1 Tax=Salix viminalis TaxID=40686 RepID=A0A6N2L8U3_SALVM